MCVVGAGIHTHAGVRGGGDCLRPYIGMDFPRRRVRDVLAVDEVGHEQGPPGGRLLEERVLFLVHLRGQQEELLRTVADLARPRRYPGGVGFHLGDGRL